jgi:Ca2+/Na+ antiporter
VDIMSESHFMHYWVNLLGSFAMIAITLTALGLMIGVVKPSNAPKHIVAILGILVALILILCALVNAWSAMSPWQRIGLAVLCVFVGILRRPRRKKPRRTET